MSQPKRTETLERFKNGEVRLLVASDVAARGLDIKGMSHVFCFDVPIHAEDYVHRIGRTGRAGLSGRSFMLAAPEDGKAVAEIVKLIGSEIPLVEIEGIASASSTTAHAAGAAPACARRRTACCFARPAARSRAPPRRRPGPRARLPQRQCHGSSTNVGRASRPAESARRGVAGASRTACERHKRSSRSCEWRCREMARK